VECEGRRDAIPHISALDGARGLAVAGVLLFHGGHLLGGYLGVDFFFTLSGFLITSLLLAELSRTGSVGLGGFWARRARRLLPALALLMVGVVLYSWGFASRTQLGQIRGDAFATLAYVANWHEIFSHQNYFALFAGPSPLNHTWSLAIEEQFYLIWPLMFFGLLTRFKHATPKAVLVTALVLATASSALMIVLYDPANVSRVYYGTDTRAAAILFGAALAAWLAVHGPVTNRNARIALEVFGLTGVAVLAVAWTRLDGQSSTLYRGGFLVCGLAATAIIAAAVHPQTGPISRVLSLGPLCALGLISYGVYLYHWPIDIVLDEQRIGLAGWPLFAVQLIVTLSIAFASYRLIEQPIRHGALSSAQWRKLTPAIATALTVAIFASTLGAQSPASVYVPSDPLNAAALAFASAPANAERVMIVGNSVAAFLGQSMRAVKTQPPLAVFDAAVVGCRFPPDIPGVGFKVVGGVVTHVPAPPCDPPWEAGAIARFHPDVVFWINDDIRLGGTYHGRTIQPCSKSYDSLYQQSLKHELQRLAQGGARVVATTEAYSTYLLTEVSHPATDCENRMTRTVAAQTGTQLVDLFSYICPHGQCRTKQHGVTLRPDGVHYDGPGGEIVAQWLIDQVLGRSSGSQS
jgi:peptidoglycan/LPS O-acetylase OafA/YrhL